jgi:MYXO-CTERM domain-containing protein
MRIPIVVLLSLCASTALAADPVISFAPPPGDFGAKPALSAEELEGLPSHWQGDMLFTPDGMPADAFVQLGRAPQHAFNYEPTVGILYLAMEGVSLSSSCGNGDSANSALNCSPLVDGDVNFPAYGNGSAQAALFQELEGFYAAFNLVLTSERPPDWVPYTMAVIGGSSGLAGQGGGVCGIANVACDGLKRNHVSLTFPESCGGVAETVAQETSHNWGLEHVNDSGDLMYPFNNGGFKQFKPECNAIDHSTGDGITQCGYIHEIYCGNEEQQNANDELLGVFGPRVPDTSPPEITEMIPADGTVLNEGESLAPTARVTEDSNFLGAKWSVLESPIPEDLNEVTTCTNNVCTYDYSLGVGFDPDEVNWDFVNIAGAPPGTYTFKFEVMDAYGQYDTETVTIEIVPSEGEDSADSGSATDATADGGTEGEGGSVDGDDDDDGDDGDDDDGDEDDDESGSDTLPADGEGGSPERGCNCRSDGDVPARWAWLVLTVVAFRRRRAA